MFKTILFCFLFFIVCTSLNAQNTNDKKNNSKKIVVFDTAPVLPGCENIPQRGSRKCFQVKINEHVIKNFRYPKKAKKKKLEGRALVSFIINKEGVIVINKIKATHKIFEKEAIRIFKLLPKAIPAQLEGAPIDATFAYPINFKL